MDDKGLHLFNSLFKGRTDVFAIRWEKSARSAAGKSKSGYVPAYQFDPYRYRQHKITGGTFKNYKDKTYLPLTDYQLEKHFNGDQLIGIYALLPDNTSWFIAADFDKENWINDCKKLIIACEERNSNQMKRSEIREDH